MYRQNLKDKMETTYHKIAEHAENKGNMSLCKEQNKSLGMNASEMEIFP